MWTSDGTETAVLPIREVHFGVCEKDRDVGGENAGTMKSGSKRLALHINLVLQIEHIPIAIAGRYCSPRELRSADSKL